MNHVELIALTFRIFNFPSCGIEFASFSHMIQYTEAIAWALSLTRSESHIQFVESALQPDRKLVAFHSFLSSKV